MRALPLRLCAPVLVLTGAECSDLLREWLGLAAPGLLRSNAGTCRAQFALKEQCRQFVVLVVLLLLVRDVV